MFILTRGFALSACRNLFLAIVFFGFPIAPSGAWAGIGMDEESAGAGIKEALGVGTTRAADRLGQLDGYLKNPEVRIPMPEKLKRIGQSLRKLGMDGMVDEFEVSMNRAAEAAAPLAKEVFINTIKQMSIQDAVRIVRGKEHEATDYLRENAGPHLDERFRPIVVDQLEAVGATDAFNDLMGRAESLPFVSKPVFDLETYVTGRALDGLFLMIAREEEKIRKDPLARTTDLLKKVFGGAGKEERKKKPWWKRISSRDD